MSEKRLRAALVEAGLGHLTLTQAPGDVWLLRGADASDLPEVWRAARELVPVTGRWPAAVLDDLWYPESPPDPRGQVEALARAAATIDPSTVFPAWVNDLPETADDLARLVGHRFPTQEGLLDRMVRDLGVPTTEPAWDAWLYEQLLADPQLRAQVDVSYLRSSRRLYRPPETALALLPDARGWLAPAFLSFHSCEDRERAAALAAVQRRWEQDHGAELVAHWGTMLEYAVARPPTDPWDAYRLAGEQKDIASSLRMYRYELALALPDNDTWFLHDRP